MTTNMTMPNASCTTYSVPMARPGRRRLRRRSMSPNRPVLFPEQYPLAAVTVIVALGSIAFVVWIFVR
jgi:hypothetical protein